MARAGRKEVLVAMTKVQIVGRKHHVEPILERLHRMGLLELISARDEPALELASIAGEDRRAARVQEQRLVLAQLDGLLTLAGDSAATVVAVDAASSDDIRRELNTIFPLVEPLAARIEDLQTELVVLPRYIEPLSRLLPLVPELAELDESEIRALRLNAVAIVLNTSDENVVDVLREALRTELGDRFVLVSVRVEPDAIGCVIVTPRTAADGVQTVLGRERVRPVPLPSQYETLSFRGAVTAMETRLREIPAELDHVQIELQALLAPRAPAWRAARRRLLGDVEQLEAVAQAGATARAFVILGWTPRERVPELRLELERAADGQLALDEVSTPPETEPPVLMRNRTLARPFEFLVRFLDLPRAGSLDPTILVALFLPLMVGVMVGDVVYGTLLLVIALLVRRRFAAGSAALRDLSRVFVVGAIWAIIFGVLFGEALGNVGHELGLPALWFYRGGAEAVQPLLLFSLALGAGHVVLGQLLGLWQSASARRRVEFVNRFGSLLALGGVFALAGFATHRVPGGMLASVIAGTAVAAGLLLLIAGRGALGLVMGPLELVGTFGNVLSYLRLAAVGLASTYLAMVANELTVVGPIWLGIFVGVFFHALNLALASFSPMIQALRLHYVEFFSKFYEGGGQPFRPFGAPLAP
jgi:V/A-type H+/Na+-transporting ATPase subunit I